MTNKDNWFERHCHITGFLKVSQSKTDAYIRKKICDKIIIPKSKSQDNNGESLTKKQAQEIRELYAAGGIFQWEVARKFKVCTATVNRILKGTTYQ